MRPAGAGNFLKWRRSIAEHLELRRLSWHEYAMFNWLCTKAHPYTGTVRTSWPTLATETGLSANHAEKLCRSLKQKGYVWYPGHRGARRRLVEVAIDKFPLAGGGYTALARRRGGGVAELPADRMAEVPAEVLAEVLAELPAEVQTKPPAKARGWPPARSEIREREREQERDASPLRARRHVDAPAEGSDPRATPDPGPVAIRDLLARQPWWRPPTDDGRPTRADGRPSPMAGPGAAR